MYMIFLNLLCIMLIIGVHEAGHLLFAKRFGVPVPEFSVGLGPVIYAREFGETRYALRLIPFGGYVYIPSKKVEQLSTWRQIQIYLGGPLANLLLCIVSGVALVLAGYRLNVMEGVPEYLLPLWVLAVTLLLFVALVPLTVYILGDIILHPVANFDKMSGPIGIVKGDGVPHTFLDGQPLLIQALIIIYMLSLSVGTFNLVPISMFDGGRIFRALFSRFPTFIKVWDWGTGILLALIVIYVLGGDLVKLGADVLKLFH